MSRKKLSSCLDSLFGYAALWICAVVFAREYGKLHHTQKNELLWQRILQMFTCKVFDWSVLWTCDRNGLLFFVYKKPELSNLDRRFFVKCSRSELHINGEKINTHLAPPPS